MLEEKTPEKEFESAMFYLKWGIEYWQKALKELPKHLKQEMEQNAEYGYKELASLILQATNDVKKFDENIQIQKQKILDELDQTWEELYQKKQEIDKKIKTFNDNEFNIDTYRMTEMLKILRAINDINPETWKNFELICTKLKEIK